MERRRREVGIRGSHQGEGQVGDGKEGDGKGFLAGDVHDRDSREGGDEGRQAGDVRQGLRGLWRIPSQPTAAATVAEAEAEAAVESAPFVYCFC